MREQYLRAGGDILLAVDGSKQYDFIGGCETSGFAELTLSVIGFPRCRTTGLSDIEWMRWVSLELVKSSPRNLARGCGLEQTMTSRTQGDEHSISFLKFN